VAAVNILAAVAAVRILLGNRLCDSHPVTVGLQAPLTYRASRGATPLHADELGRLTAT
jgi:hypothetical protein